MLTPILTVRTATGLAEEASARPQQPATPLTAAQRGEAIQKILDALTRHLAGREILSKDALVRLMEDLARILKFPPLPQEGGRDFVRRLVTFLEAMPMPERLALERQLGGRSLALRVGILADLPAIRNGAVPVSTGAVLPSPSNPPLQPAIPLHLATARASVASEVALLQTALKKTFGVGSENDTSSLATEEADATLPTDDGAAARPQASPEREGARTMPGRLPSLDGPEIEALAAIVSGEADPEATDPAAAGKAPADEEENPSSHPAAAADDLDLPAKATEAEPSNGAARTDAGTEVGRADEGAEPDGTYRPLPDGDDQRPNGRTTTRGEAGRALSDALKAIVRDTLGLPGEPTGTERPEVIAPELESAETSAASSQTETDGAEPGRTNPLRPRDTAAGAELAALSVADDQTEQSGATGATAAQRPQKPADDPAMQQAIARLIENGLPREAIPFAMIPYPIAVEDGKSETEKSERDEGRGEGGEEPQDDSEAAQGDANKDAQQTEDGKDGRGDEQNAEPDVYELYRKLGGLG
ncbi:MULTISPECIES: hypothetical protein [unclassified Ensifer]|uniref:hypothetical protein n=1 Tax=unclassified Ensifer TaxID=2633371 RepID=UPI0008137DD1|nr:MULTISPECIES: hypothetical protein [unclassified Ensifer]OCP20974.1 hypothetical protein BC363_29200 [Ensifer sp. LC384]OCP21215.1 hypothetical protein BC361_27120 [Ensifer sp. LC54]